MSAQRITKMDVERAVQEERQRCADIADAVEKRALSDGMLAYAAAAKEIAEKVRASQ